MWDLKPTLTGDLVRLEPLDPRHFAGLYEAARHPEIWQWWPFDPARSEESFRDWFASALDAGAEGRAFHFATVSQAADQPMGSTSFCTPRPEHRGVEIGWTWLTPSAWGTGANAEAKLLQLEYAFTELECVRVEFETDEQNQRSRRALEALPAKFEGVLRDWRIRDDGTRRSSAYYSILEAEWPAASANLRRRLEACIQSPG
jgi:RimJ/RimL family protein N-acetyltransferase